MMLVTTLLLILAGLPIALALPARPRRWYGIVGESWLLGAGAATLVLFALSLAGIRWSRASLGIGVLVITALAALRASWKIEPVKLGLTNLVDLLTAALMGGHVLLATAAPPIENDYLLIWGVKARVFFAAGGIDWSWLEAPLNVTSHPDYPLLVPFLYDVHAIVSGAAPHAIGFVTFAFGAAALLAIRNLLGDELPPLAAAVVTLILMPLVFSPFIGIAEGPLIAYMTVGVLHVRRGDVLAGAVFLGLAAWCKNEGLAMIVAVAIAMIVAREWRRLVALWPAIAIPLPWLVVHRVHGLRVDLVAAGTVERLAERIAEPGAIVSTLVQRSGMPLVFWIGIAAAIAIGVRRLVREERFLVVAALLQLLVCAGVYFMTPRDLAWHIETSWARVLRQILPLIVIAAVIGSLPRRNNATDPRTDRAPRSAGTA